MPLQLFACHYKRPLKIDPYIKERIFEVMEGDDEVIEDAKPRRQFPVNVLWQGYKRNKELLQFIHEHRLGESFLFQIEGDPAPVEVKIVDKGSEVRMLAYGVKELVFREVNPSPTDFEDPTVPADLAITNVIPTTGFSASYTAATDNVAVTGYKLRLNGPGYINHIEDAGNVTDPDVTGLTLAGGSFTVEVAAYDADGNQSGWSAPVGFTVAVNVALPANGGSATASSFYSSTYSPDKAIDGIADATHQWRTTGAVPQWLEIAFGQSRTINQVILKSYAGTNAPKSFQFEYWNGSAWVLIEAFTDNLSATVTSDFAEISTEKIRVYVTAKYTANIYVFEVEAMGY